MPPFTAFWFFSIRGKLSIDNSIPKWKLFSTGKKYDIYTQLVAYKLVLKFEKYYYYTLRSLPLRLLTSVPSTVFCHSGLAGILL
jgi:hypothetical protein